MGGRRDYLTIHNFNVEVDGVIVGGFKEVDGIERKTEIIEYKDGNEIIMHKRPGKTAYSNIILRRGFLNGPELWNWSQTVINGVTERKSGSLIMLADDGVTEVMRYNFFEAWPCRWKGPAVQSTGDTHTVEEIELACEKWERVGG